ncbi:MAG: urate hydroxylase PuuD [Steroidobacteraceae bacterium]
MLAIVVMVLPMTPGGDFSQLSLARWGHIVAGVFWIGLLYYFNVAQIPALAAANADKGGPGGAGITKHVAPRALLWFRWAAVATWLTGAWLLSERLVPAFTLQEGNVVIGIGAWLGTIMLFNVWVLIWPNQKKVLGIVAASDEEKAKARRTATLASRTNFLLSIPMLMCMGGASHGLPF